MICDTEIHEDTNKTKRMLRDEDEDTENNSGENKERERESEWEIQTSDGIEEYKM